MKYDVANRRIWYKGEILNVNDAKINILAPTAQFGLNVFEGIPCYWNDEQKQLFAFRLDDHYARLLKSAKLIQLECPYTAAEMKSALIDVVRANEYYEYIRTANAFRRRVRVVGDFRADGYVHCADSQRRNEQGVQ